MSIDLFDNEWETGSGLPLAGADVEVIACSFGYNAVYSTEALCAMFTFQNLEGGEPQQQSFSVGKFWEAADNSDAIVSEDGRKRRISGVSNYGRLIDSAVAAVKLAGADMPFASPRIASGWVGTKWRIDTVPITNNYKGVETTKDAFVFTAYLGADAATNSTTAGSAGSNVAVKVTSSKSAAASPTGIDGDLHVALTSLAKQHSDDHDAFVDAALELDGVEGNKMVERAILASSGAKSIWAEANS